MTGTAKDEIRVDPENNLTLKELLKYVIFTLRPSLLKITTENKDPITQFTVAVNGKLVHDLNTLLKDGDIVLLMIPIAGG